MKRILSWILILTFALSVGMPVDPVGATPSMGLPISAGSALLLDVATQRVLYAKDPHSRRQPASTTKIMTALVVMERLSLDQTVRIPGWVGSVEASKANLRPGERYRVRDLLHATLISSANDAAEVLSIAAAGSRAQFAQWMNVKARAIGCRDSHFTNASGLPLGSQYSSVYDLALIMKEAKKNPFIVDSLSRKYHSIQSLEGRRIHLKNHNRLLWRSRQSVIGKTGYTRKGMHCFVGRIQWKGREVLISMLGSHRLWKDLKVLLDYQFGLAFYKMAQNRKVWSTTQMREIQEALERAGFPTGARDGKLGPRTIHAVEHFQKARGLAPDGVVGIKTCRELSRYGFPKSYCR